ncbi:MAG: hypothetical protein OHK93_002331 [Ramalina farinacea]|uniref:Uncharacterized protein n=1 Tax=Ramalina farinacea TaxID=258253 RepID=A0AA43QR89_9LECA|nr:hypothetical protein [Ramalina farinacea]
MATAFPPHRTHTSHRIPPSQALALLSTYLDNATTDPSLHPNALLTENGPVTPGAGSNVGLVLHNLHRVQAGLQGEHLAADIPIKKSATGSVDGDSDGFSGVITPGGNFYESDRPRRAVGDSTKEGDWQDLGEFEREQEDDVVRADGVEKGVGGQVVKGLVFGGREEEEEEEPKVNGYHHHVDDGGINGDRNVDRNARKRDKKERNKQMKREEQERRDRERNAEV